MSELVDQPGFYQIDKGIFRGTFIALIYDTETKKYVVFDDKCKPVGLATRNAIVRSVNTGNMHLVKVITDTIQVMRKKAAD